MNLVSVIVPVYNAKQWLSECVESVLKQSYSEIELILVDDGSTDGAAQLCDHYSEKDSRVKVIHKVNAGAEKARETGVEEARGVYTMFIDADDYLKERTILEEAVRKLEQHQADIACFDYWHKDRLGFHIQKEELLDWKTGVRDMLLRKNLDGNLWCKLYCTRLVKNTKVRFEDKHCCDFLTSIQIMEQANRIVQIPSCGYYYRYVEESYSRSDTCHPQEEIYEREALKLHEQLRLKYPNIAAASEYNWLMALLYVCVKMEKDTSLSRNSERFSTEKSRFRKAGRLFLTNSHITYRDKLQYILCYLNLFRMIYYLYGCTKSKHLGE